MKWVRTWLVTTWRTDDLAKVEQVARTAAELRTLIEQARSDGAVRRWRQTSRRELVGDLPTRCADGHPLHTRGTMATPHDWVDCTCGGHWWISCGRCGDEAIAPEIVYDCQPRWPSPT